MKLVWSPEMASKAYIDTIKSCKLSQESGEAEMISAMAGGWNAKLIVEAWFNGDSTTTSIGLAIAAAHSGARHVCMVQNERCRSGYIAAMQSRGISGIPPPEMVVGEAEEVMLGLPGVDFMVVDGRRKDFSRVLRFANLSHRGAVLICNNSSLRAMAGFRWDAVLGSDTRVIRSLVLPIGRGLDIAYVGKNSGSKNSSVHRHHWITHIDRESGEEHVLRG